MAALRSTTMLYRSASNERDRELEEFSVEEFFRNREIYRDRANTFEELRRH
jgi:hypothetical protein